jgi:glycosyltransferase involved in cell wall biosynthesis
MLIGIETSAASLESAGDTTYMRELLTGLARIDTRNHYRLIAVRPHPFYAQLTERFTFHRLPRPWSLLRYFSSLTWELRRHPVDVFHVQYILPTGYSGRAVATIHDLHFEHYPLHYPLVDRLFLKTFVRRTALRVDKILTDSTHSKHDLRTRYGLSDEKIAVIPLGINSRFRPEPNPERLRAVREKYGIAERFILFIGRLVDQRKNASLLMEAFITLGREAACGHQLVIAGKNEGRGPQALAAKAQTLGEGRIHFPGFIAEADVPALMSAATIFVYPSLFEGFGLPPLEAMACGTPVISSNATSLPEVVGDAALLINPHHKDELVEALRRLLADADLRQHLRELGLQRAAQYVWETCARQTLAVYEDVYRTASTTA